MANPRFYRCRLLREGMGEGRNELNGIVGEIKENRIKKDYGFIKSFIRVVKDEMIARQFFFFFSSYD